MKPKKQISVDTDRLLTSLDGIQKAGPGAFFFTRVQARLQREEKGFWGRIAFFITKPTIALATLCLIFLVNAAALYHQQQKTSAGNMADQVEQNAEDYNTTLAANTYYDENSEAR